MELHPRITVGIDEFNNGLSCTTPCNIKVKRRSDLVVTIERQGYESVTATVTSSVDSAGAAGMAGNVLIGGIIGAGIDAGTGAIHSHKPNPLKVTMVADDAPPGTAVGPDNLCRPVLLQVMQRLGASAGANSNSTRVGDKLPRISQP